MRASLKLLGVRQVMSRIGIFVGKGAGFDGGFSKVYARICGFGGPSNGGCVLCFGKLEA